MRPPDPVTTMLTWAIVLLVAVASAALLWKAGVDKALASERAAMEARCLGEGHIPLTLATGHRCLDPRQLRMVRP